MALRYALLGLLHAEPASGYELTKKFERALQRYAWHANHSQIYPALTQLAHEGLIAVVEHGPRGRRTYAITEAGRVQLRQWMLAAPDESLVRHEFVLRLFLLSTLEVPEARALLQQQVADSMREAERLRGVVERTDPRNTPTAPAPFGRLAAGYGLRYYEMLRDWALWALDELEHAEQREPPPELRP